jgi:hypothetical protein
MLTKEMWATISNVWFVTHLNVSEKNLRLAIAFFNRPCMRIPSSRHSVTPVRKDEPCEVYVPR